MTIRRAGSSFGLGGGGGAKTLGGSRFFFLLGAHQWRRQLFGMEGGGGGRVPYVSGFRDLV